MLERRAVDQSIRQAALFQAACGSMRNCFIPLLFWEVLPLPE
jgi:hypothetical protein